MTIIRVVAAYAERGRRPILEAAWWAGSSTRRTWAASTTLALVVYGLTAKWPSLGSSNNSDAVVASWPAWNFVRTGSLWLDGVSGLPDLPGFYESGGHVTVSRTPGVILVSVPAQLLFRWSTSGPLTPAVLTAVVLSAMAVGNVAVVLRRLLPWERALACAAVLGFGTGLWTVASADLWTHGPDAFWLSLALLALTRDRLWLAGALLAPAILTRTHIAAVAAAVGLWLLWSRRSLWPALAVGIPAASGLAALLLWNDLYYGAGSIGSAYPYATANLTATEGTASTAFLVNVAGNLISPMHGLLWYTPVAVLALVATRPGWRAAPDWARGAFIGGLLYAVAQIRISPSFTGGFHYFSNRYLIETLVLAAPLWTVGFHHWVGRRPARRRTAGALAVGSIVIHTLGALLPSTTAVFDPPSPWRTWLPWVAVRDNPVPAVVLVAMAAAAALVWSALRQSQGQDPPATHTTAARSRPAEQSAQHGQPQADPS